MTGDPEVERGNHRPGNLAEFFAESPLRGSGLVIERERTVSCNRDYFDDLDDLDEQ
ncbi:hypothetical protein [Nocardia sp. BMG51109]|uniref:hypothetical protein n=1 Tax=Nocardia sp. BMG51109 TaxID=1056816 RepID=UPI0004B91D3F|nr:hypothetical protein [Nocardia sp. BMG51109]